jgi:hypothetical protein
LSSSLGPALEFVQVVTSKEAERKASETRRKSLNEVEHLQLALEALWSVMTGTCIGLVLLIFAAAMPLAALFDLYRWLRYSRGSPITPAA